MASVTHGMNIVEVEALGRRLQDVHAVSVRDLVTEIERLVGGTSSSWAGGDADAFRSWWPGKRTRLLAMADDLAGFGQSALNNAQEQTNASGADGAEGGSAGSAAGRRVTGSHVGGEPASDPAGGTLPGSDRSWQQVEAAYKRNYLDYGLWSDGAPGGENQYQCVSWAWFRMRELGFAGPQTQGNGLAIAGNLGGTTSTVPESGAVLSWGSGFGHVVIAEEVTHNSDGSMSVRVSEMNAGDSDYYHGHANEYRSDRVLTRSSDGTWLDGGVTRSVVVANPDYGKPRI